MSNNKLYEVNHVINVKFTPWFHFENRPYVDLVTLGLHTFIERSQMTRMSFFLKTSLNIKHLLL